MCIYWGVNELQTYKQMVTEWLIVGDEVDEAQMAQWLE